MRFIFIILFLVSCSHQAKWTADAFYEQVFDIIKESSVKKNEIDWDALKEDVKDSIGRFETNEDVYRAIGYTVKLIDDGHSIFSDAHTPNNLNLDTLLIPELSTKIVGKNVGYLQIPGFFGNDSISSIYTLEIRKALKELDNTQNLSGWIIDLRGNGGGKLSTVPLGISPLFENALIGISWDNKGVFREISCSGNYFYFGDHKIDSLSYDTTLINKGKKIAVLVDEGTASAGEFLTLGLKFQDRTQVFGSKTQGLTSHLSLINFKTNAKLLLATSYYCDKNKNIIDGPLVPDVVCSSEECLMQAIEWIEDAI